MRYTNRYCYKLHKAIMLFFYVCLLLPAQGICGSGNADNLITVNFDNSLTIPQGLKPETTGYSPYVAMWQVVPCVVAPSSPNILKITEINTPAGGQFNICWTRGIEFKDGTIEVKIRADQGRIDQGGGPMWRVRDRNNYYVARLNPLEDNFRIYFVKRGQRSMIASADVHGIKAGRWFTLRIETHGNRITGYVNGKKLIETDDSTFSGSGGVGLWTKADAASSFDDLVIRTSN